MLKTKEVLATILKKRGIPLTHISRATGIHGSTLSEWVGGRTPTDPYQARQVAHFLGVSLHFFYFGEEETGLIPASSVASRSPEL